MLEGLAAYVLNNYIGEYLENLNTDQLSLQLLQGQLELDHVPLKKSALRKFDIPLTVKCGVLGKLTLSIPWTAFRSEPWRIEISDLFVLLSPSDNKYDVEFDEEYQKARKQQQLDALEAFHKKQLHECLGSEYVDESNSYAANGGGGGGGGWLTYGASVVSHIVENIHLTLSNVHIRYEDEETLSAAGQSFAAGIQINQMTVESTNQFWKTGFRERRGGENLFKVLGLEGASVYWDSNVDIRQTPETLRDLIVTRLFLSCKTRGRLTESNDPATRTSPKPFVWLDKSGSSCCCCWGDRSVLGHGQDVLSNDNEKHCYVVSPISAQIRMEKNASKFPLKTRPPIPRFKFELEPKSLKLEMSKRQLLEMRLLSREWARYDRGRQHRKWRPKESVEKCVRKWWKFAINCHLETIRRARERESWSYANVRARQVIAYAAAYRRRLAAQVQLVLNRLEHERRVLEGEHGSPLKEIPRISDADNILIKQIERDPQYSYEDLHILRDTVFRKYLKETREKHGSQHAATGRASGLRSNVSDPFLHAMDDGFEALGGIQTPTSSGQYDSPSPTPRRGSDGGMDNMPSPPTATGGGGGLSGWLYSWFAPAAGEGGGSVVEDGVGRGTDEKGSGGAAADQWDSFEPPPGWTEQNLPPYLKEAEKHFEEGILDVLNESWDDSTVLRRDTLLARIQLKLQSMDLTFLDDHQSSSQLQSPCDGGGISSFSNNGSSTTKLLACQLSQVFSSIELSPRHNSTAFNLTVGDLSICSELLSTAPTDTSLFWSAGMNTVFALGRAQMPSPTGEMPSTSLFKTKPLMKLSYSRKVSKFIARHGMNVEFSPISVMYQAAAYQMMTQFFESTLPGEDGRIVLSPQTSSFGGNVQQEQQPAVAVVMAPDIYTTEVNACIQLPSVSVELRSEMSTNSAPEPSQSSQSPRQQPSSPPSSKTKISSPADSFLSPRAFACAHFNQLKVNIAKQEAHKLDIECEMGGIAIEDLLDGQDQPHLKYILRTGTGTKRPLLMNKLGLPESNSCPNLSPPETTQTSSSADDSTSTASPPAEEESNVFVTPESSVPRNSTSSSSLPASPLLQRSWLGNHHQGATITSPRSGQSQTMSRKNSMTGSNNGDSSSSKFSITLVNSSHHAYKTDYKKIGCLIDCKLPWIELNFNPQTFVLLLDFLGVITPPPPPITMQDIVQSPRSQRREEVKVDEDGSRTEVKLSAGCLRLRMNNPAPSNTALATLTLNNVQSTVNVTPDALEILGEGDNPRLIDETPCTSILYPWKLWPVDPQSLVTLKIHKFSRPDPGLLRDYDLSISIEASGLNYVHTQRFTLDLVNYWMYFVDLMEYLTFIKTELRHASHVQNNGRGTRAALSVAISEGVSLVLPINSLSSDCLLAQINDGSLTLNNSFLFASQKTNPIPVVNATDDHNCLLDFMYLICPKTTIHPATRVHASQINEKTNLTGFKRIDCDDYCIISEIPSILKTPIELTVSIERNLDGSVSKNVADLAITASVARTDCRVTLDTYKLVRGFLDHNLGEHLPPPPPSLLPNRTYSSMEPFTTFSFVLELTNIQLDCYWPQAPGWAPLGEIDFSSAKLIFESTSDGNREIDLIITSGSLKDTRYEDLAENKKPNVFPEIMIKKLKGMTANGVTNSGLLMAEVHYLCGPGMEPKLTVLLSDLRLLYITDWICAARDFIGSNSDFVPPPNEIQQQQQQQQSRKASAGATNTNTGSSTSSPVSSSTTGGGGPPTTATRKLNLKGSKMGLQALHNAATIQPGVIQRSSLQEQGLDGLSATLNLRNCDVVILESPSNRSSLAFLLKMTVVLNYRDIRGQPTFKLEGSAIQLSTCLLNDWEETESPLTDDFKATLEMGLESESLAKRLTKAAQPGLYGFNPALHHIQISVEGLVGRVSYRDYLMCESILTSFMKYSFGNPSPSVTEQQPNESFDRSSPSCSPSSSSAPPPATSTKPPEPRQQQSKYLLSRVTVITEGISVWLLDDFEETRFPLVRFGIKDGTFTQFPMESAKIMGQMQFYSDFFNQKIYGWEPLVEQWLIEEFNWEQLKRNDRDSIIFYLGTPNVLDLNVTETFLEQVAQFNRRWPTVQRHVKAEHRNNMTAGSDYLPYLLSNETGSDITYTTYTTSVKGKTKHNWRHCSRSSKDPFKFPNLYSSASTDTFSTHQVIIKVDGWHETSPVTVDSVGTYFRFIKFENAHSGSKLQKLPTTSRLVINVNTDQDGRKIVTVRSSLSLVNALLDTLQVQFSNRLGGSTAETKSMYLGTGQVLHVPLLYAFSNIQVRPVGVHSCSYCPVIRWDDVREPGATRNIIRDCRTEGQNTPYKICVSLHREHYPNDDIPGHTVTFLPPLTLLNLLPVELSFQLTNYNRYHDRIPPKHKTSFLMVDPLKPLQISLATEMFHMKSPYLMVPKDSDESTYQLLMIDGQNRKLQLDCTLSPGRGGALQLSVSAPYWIVNRTGIPIVIRQEATREEPSAGQFDENEKARAMTPLMFSFVAADSPSRCEIRVGNDWEYKRGYTPKWAQKFPLEPGITHRKLLLQPPNRGLAPYIIYVGIEVRKGQGLYSNTHIVIFTAQFQLDNRSRYTLLVAQQQREPESKDNADSRATSVAPNCSLPWHWPNQDEDTQYLRVKRTDLPYWSSGFWLRTLQSFHLTMRGKDLEPQFVRVEITLNGATYNVTFSDADSVPPPIRIQNYSKVPILYRQYCQYYQIPHSSGGGGGSSGSAGMPSPGSDHHKAIIRPNTKVDYNWDIPTLRELMLELTVYGELTGNHTQCYTIDRIGNREPLMYPNFFYLTFRATFPDPHSSSNQSKVPSERKELVLDVLKTGKVILNKMNVNCRTQLWRMNADAQLINVGFSELEGTMLRGTARSGEKREESVLDIMGSPDPLTYMPLMIRASEQKRRITQRWSFTVDGRIQCDLKSCWIQAGNASLIAGNSVVLGGTMPQSKTMTDTPYEQLIHKQRQKPGSGNLGVVVFHEGPTRVLEIYDKGEGKRSTYDKQKSVDRGGSGVSLVSMSDRKSVDFELSIILSAGLGVSLVNRYHEELMYARFEMVNLRCTRQLNQYTFSGYVMKLQADNQLLACESYRLLFIRARSMEEPDMPSGSSTSGAGSGSNKEISMIPALQWEINYTPMSSYDSFEAFRLQIRNINLRMEEPLMWKLVDFFGLHSTISSGSVNGGSAVAVSWSGGGQRNNMSTSASSNQMANNAPDGGHQLMTDCVGGPVARYIRLDEPNVEVVGPDPSKARRCYFGHLMLQCPRMHLSMLNVPIASLPPRLRQIKREMGIWLIRFEDAPINLQDFRQVYYFQTLDFLTDAFTEHYKKELRNQALHIMGSVDFLGNPTGLYNDVAGGFKDLMIEGSIGGFVSGVGHGVSNSFAKVTSSFADGIGKLTKDDEGHYAELRKQVRVAQNTAGKSSISHLYTGVKGLGFGILGGVTSLATEPVQGAIKHGPTGLITGTMKGVAKMVARPMQGVLDFGTGAFTAFREGVATESGAYYQRHAPFQIRLPRVTRSLTNTLPPYSYNHAYAQKLLMDTVGTDDELCLSVEVLNEEKHQKENQVFNRALVCTRRVYFIRTTIGTTEDESRVTLMRDYSKIEACNAEQMSDNQYILKIVLKQESNVMPADRVLCHSKEIAERMCRQILYAKQQQDDMRRCLHIPEDFSLQIVSA